MSKVKQEKATEAKSAAGRKTKRTPEVEAELFDALRKGNTRRAACASAGIGESTLNDWINEFPEFSAALTHAENLAETGYVNVVQLAAQNGDWKAAAWWLERRRKQEYSARIEQDISGRLKLEVTAEDLSDDELAAIVKHQP